MNEPELHAEDLIKLWEIQDAAKVALDRAQETGHPAWQGAFDKRAGLFHTQRAYCDALALSAEWFEAEQKGLTA